ncbi:hypothetical protein [Spirochaeta africana]|uniref:SGNH hydrolase-type esterase domain-containing protein n=1 Tax=Spirochaeta africana (strain ATCC 700263 / DSM 8902 / Z-7692) TaxID=889378 RepID=H9UG41_SPIAZ|nr:hypothetical protein [Spirochaeta africana]AFG36484.1 hypothetical protein Spiaf_0379 [Spirochaeta africana DSM 8902]
MKLLCIGNSHTYMNNLAGMLQSLAGQAGRELCVERITSPWKTLSWHWYDNPKTLEQIDAGGWDAVLLQDHSLRPLEEYPQFERAVGQFANRIRAVGARPLLFSLWPRQHLPEQLPEITEACSRAAVRHRLELVPIGQAWQHAQELAAGEDLELQLYQRDGSHPSIPGSYLAACVLYGVVCQADPAGLGDSYAGEPGCTITLGSRIAGLLRSAAARAITGS